MSKNTSTSIGDHFASFIDTQIQAGLYFSVSEVVWVGLRLLEEQEVKVKALHNALVAGENSGTLDPFDNAAFLHRMHAKHARSGRPIPPACRLNYTSVVSARSEAPMGVPISIRLDDDIRDELEAQARAAGVGLATHLRNLATAAAREAKRARIRQASHAIGLKAAKPGAVKTFYQDWGTPNAKPGK